MTRKWYDVNRWFVPLLVLMTLFNSSSVSAEEKPFLWQKGHEFVYNVLSDASVTFLIVKDAKDSWIHSTKEDKLSHVCRFGSMAAALKFQKPFFSRERPNGSDFNSFPSGHSGFAFVSAKGWSYFVAFPVPVWRQAAGQHYLSDTLVGSAEGFLIRLGCDKLIR